MNLGRNAPGRKCSSQSGKHSTDRSRASASVLQYVSELLKSVNTPFRKYTFVFHGNRSLTVAALIGACSGIPGYKDSLAVDGERSLTFAALIGLANAENPTSPSLGEDRDGHGCH